MNIALSAVIIFILLLPPLAFYLALTFGDFPKARPKIGLLEGVMLSAIFAVILHSTSIIFIHKEIRFDILVLLIGGDVKTISTLVPNENFEKYFHQFSFYSCLLTILSFIMGRYFRWWLNKSRSHVDSELFRLYTHWWYLFNGYKIEEYTDRKKLPLFDAVAVDALVNTNAGTMLYSGYLIDFVCHGESLDRIYLSGTIKREFKTNEVNEGGNVLINEPGVPKLVKGDTMSIPYSGILNMNLHFISLSEEMEDSKRGPG